MRRRTQATTMSTNRKYCNKIKTQPPRLLKDINHVFPIGISKNVDTKWWNFGKKNNFTCEWIWIPSAIMWRTTHAIKIATTTTKLKHNQHSLKDVDHTFPIGISKNVETTLSHFLQSTIWWSFIMDNVKSVILHCKGAAIFHHLDWHCGWNISCFLASKTGSLMTSLVGETAVWIWWSSLFAIYIWKKTNIDHNCMICL